MIFIQRLVCIIIMFLVITLHAQVSMVEINKEKQTHKKKQKNKTNEEQRRV